MKKYVLLIIAISVMAFQACKKDELTNPDRTSRTPQTQKTEASAFNPRNIGDMDSYLTNFLKEIKSPTRDAQPMTVEDAQWHISACLNFLFSNANVNKTQIVYDTIVKFSYVDKIIEKEVPVEVEIIKYKRDALFWWLLGWAILCLVLLALKLFVLK